MSHYSRGREFEWRTRDELAAAGYDVIRSAGSKSKVDLVALKQGQALFVQCKSGASWPGPAERTELRRLANLVGALPIVASREREGRAASVITWWYLHGDGPRDRAPFVLDFGAVRLVDGLDAGPTQIRLAGLETPSMPSPVHVEARTADAGTCLCCGPKYRERRNQTAVRP